MHLPDINVWLALGFEAHVHHAMAKEWFETLEEESCAFCRLTQMGFLRVATNPKAFGTEAVRMRDAWGLYDAFQSDERVGVVHEPLQIEDRWRAHTAAGPRYAAVTPPSSHTRRTHPPHTPAAP